jgi:hypothetical protein
MTDTPAAGGNATATSPDCAERPYVRPYGDTAPWNVPAGGLPTDPNSLELAVRLWFDAPGHRPGNFNLTFDGYTYPVYDAACAAGLYRLETRWRTDGDGDSVPWHPRWRPAAGTDAQVIVLDHDHGREWNLFQVSFDGETLSATNASLVPGDFRTHVEGHPPSRGSGIPYLAMLVRPQEIERGVIEHALSMPIRATAGDRFVPPATKLEHPGHPPGIPEGTRFQLLVTDAEIQDWLARLPGDLPAATVRSAGIIAVALRDYGWFVTDTSGGAHLQFEDRLTAGAAWERLGLGVQRIDSREYPRDLLDGLILPHRIRAIVPSDDYPPQPAAPAGNDEDSGWSPEPDHGCPGCGFGIDLPGLVDLWF